MSMYVIDTDNNVTILEPDASVTEAEGPEKFNSREELAQLASTWPASRLVEIWNSLPGVVPVSIRALVEQLTLIRKTPPLFGSVDDPLQNALTTPGRGPSRVTTDDHAIRGPPDRAPRRCRCHG